MSGIEWDWVGYFVERVDGTQMVWQVCYEHKSRTVAAHIVQGSDAGAGFVVGRKCLTDDMRLFLDLNCPFGVFNAKINDD